ncbi:MAG: hypothetical protein ACT4N8_08585 [Sphingosinicella sp.]|uniref:hypothetical protein n=1 Tax=Sphingosinicella sp. TaxID=1917971 RepID=UPI0040384B7B
MRLGIRFAGMAMIVSLAACGGPEEGGGGLTAEEERRLDNAAAMLDENSIFDTSADSMVMNEAELQALDAPQGNAAAPPPPANQQ